MCPEPATQHLPLPGIEPATFCLEGWHPTSWTSQGATCLFSGFLAFCVKCWWYKGTFTKPCVNLTPSNGPIQDLPSGQYPLWPCLWVPMALGDHLIITLVTDWAGQWSAIAFFFTDFWALYKSGLYLFHGLVFQHNTQHYFMRYCSYYSHLIGGETET